MFCAAWDEATKDKSWGSSACRESCHNASNVLRLRITLAVDVVMAVMSDEVCLEEDVGENRDDAAHTDEEGRGA